MKRTPLPDRTIIRLTLLDLDTLAQMQLAIYPEPLVETRERIRSWLEGEHMNIGVVMDGKLAGFLLTTFEYAENENDIFLYDIGILPEYQKKGLGTLLLNSFLKEARKKMLKIRLSSRDTSLPMFSDPQKLAKAGYKVVRCEFEKDGYFEVAGIHEDLYDIELEPV